MTTSVNRFALPVSGEVLTNVPIQPSDDAPLNDGDKPAKKTLQKALALMVHHTMLERVDDVYRAPKNSIDFISYYANSIAHWFDEIEHINPRRVLSS